MKDIRKPLPLLGGISAQKFMEQYWQRKPLLVRQAVPGFKPLTTPSELFSLVAQEDVESRLVQQPGWRLQCGPIERKALPPLNAPNWALLVQGADLHDQRMHTLMRSFNFIADARLDDVLISYSTDGGGVGAHYDSYDVFLIQAQGRHRWRIGPVKDFALHENLPVKLLKNFQPTQEFIMEPGDLLYLPPRYAHEGTAVGHACLTYSIGFNAPVSGDIAQDLLTRLADDACDAAGSDFYTDPRPANATQTPAAIPRSLADFARKSLKKVLKTPLIVERALGEMLTEPKPRVWFAPGKPMRTLGAVELHRRTRMMYDAKHIFINGESFLASGRDAKLMQRLANQRQLSAQHVHKAGADAKALLQDWLKAGWVARAAQTPPAQNKTLARAAAKKASPTPRKTSTQPKSGTHLQRRLKRCAESMED